MIFILRIHAIGVPEGVTLLEFEGPNQEEEPEVQAIDEAAIEEELPECSDHRPSSFLKGKPRSKLSLPCGLESRSTLVEWFSKNADLFRLVTPKLCQR